MSEKDLKEIAELAAKAVASDDAGELPYYLLGVESYNRLIDLLVGLGKLNADYLQEKVEPVKPKKGVTNESKMSPPASDGTYTVRYTYLNQQGEIV